jgi:hypothetical protein
MPEFSGGCLCGSVRYRAAGEPLNQRICHCTLCQKAIGAAFNARLLMRIEDVTISGPYATFHSSENLERGFCQKCGTTIFSRRANIGIGLTAGSLDDPSLFMPDMHIWTSSRQPWLTISDGLPQFAEAAPAMPAARNNSD